MVVNDVVDNDGDDEEDDDDHLFAGRIVSGFPHSAFSNWIHSTLVVHWSKLNDL